MRTLALLTILLLASCASAPTAAPPPADPVVELFNGRDLTGWTQRGGRAIFRVEDNAIVGLTRPNQPNSFLCTESEYSDFVLDLDFLIDDTANSGVQFRSESRPDYQRGVVHGYQAEIDPSPRAWTAGIYDESRRGWLAPLDANPAARAAFRHNEWNHLRIRAVGDHLQTWLNDVPAADLHDATTPRGFIALQVHAAGADELVVKWRNLRLTDLSRPAAPTP